MPNQGRYIYYFCMRDLFINEPDLIVAWDYYHTQPFKATVKRIADLGSEMGQMEKRILSKDPKVYAGARKAFREDRKHITFKNPKTLFPAIVGRCSVKLLYYEPFD